MSYSEAARRGATGNVNRCSGCGAYFGAVSAHDGGPTGYAVRCASERRICYQCSDRLERLDALESGRAFFYLSPERNVTTWPGGVMSDHPARLQSRYRNNLTGQPVEVYHFSINGEPWTGQHYPASGDYLRARALKGKP